MNNFVKIHCFNKLCIKSYWRRGKKKSQMRFLLFFKAINCFYKKKIISKCIFCIIKGLDNSTFTSVLLITVLLLCSKIHLFHTAGYKCLCILYKFVDYKTIIILGELHCNEVWERSSFRLDRLYFGIEECQIFMWEEEREWWWCYELEWGILMVSDFMFWKNWCFKKSIIFICVVFLYNVVLRVKKSVMWKCPSLC